MGNLIPRVGCQGLMVAIHTNRCQQVGEEEESKIKERKTPTVLKRMKCMHA
jgi:hypothetical protein